MLPTRDLDFVHVFLPADPPHSNPVTLFLLHGTGGDERDLAGAVAPGRPRVAGKRVDQLLAARRAQCTALVGRGAQPEERRLVD